MNPLKDITEAAVAALRAAGAQGAPAHPSVHYGRKRADVSYFGGPPAEVVEAALDPLVESGLIKSYTVRRFDQWTCGRVHGSAAEAWASHEGRDHLIRVDGHECELGCDHGVDAIRVDTLAELVEAGETFRSKQCRPLVWPDDYHLDADKAEKGKTKA